MISIALQLELMIIFLVKVRERKHIINQYNVNLGINYLKFLTLEYAWDAVWMISYNLIYVHFILSNVILKVEQANICTLQSGINVEKIVTTIMWKIPNIAWRKDHIITGLTYLLVKIRANLLKFKLLKVNLNMLVIVKWIRK